MLTTWIWGLPVLVAVAGLWHRRACQRADHARDSAQITSRARHWPREAVWALRVVWLLAALAVVSIIWLIIAFVVRGATNGATDLLP